MFCIGARNSVKQIDYCTLNQDACNQKLKPDLDFDPTAYVSVGTHPARAAKHSAKFQSSKIKEVTEGQVGVGTNRTGLNL